MYARVRVCEGARARGFKRGERRRVWKSKSKKKIGEKNRTALKDVRKAEMR